MSKPTPATEGSPDYVWAFPGSPVRIHLSLSVVSNLREQLFTEFDPSSAKEYGGLLLGKVEAGRVHITDFRLFDTTSDGQYFVLSNSDKNNLQELIRKQGTDTSMPAVVGYFRTDLRGGIRLSQEDLALSKELFNDPRQVFLIISGKDTGRPTAGFFFWDTGSIFAEATFMQFPLDEKLLAIARAPTSPQPDAEPTASPEKIPLQSEAPLSQPRSKGSYRFVWALLLLLLVIAGGVAIYRLSNSKPRQETIAIVEPAVSSPMSLSATRANQNVTITWDSHLPAVSEARIGILTIKDGDSEKEFPLTKAQLQISKMIYITPSDRLEITFEVFSPDGKSTRESMLLAFTQPSDKSRSRVDAATVLLRRQEIQQTSTLENPSIVENVPAPVRTFRPVAPTSKANSQDRRVIINDEPPQTKVSAVDPAAIKTPDFLTPSLIKQDAPKAPESSVSIGRSLPLQPPVPLRQVRPVVPPNVSAMLKRRVDVQVRVSIDEDGKVVNAEPIVPGGGINQFLGTSAANTARLWTFQPARRGDTRVMSEMVLNFTFGPANKNE
jgi:outer membrane biosynthesis protein TonB